MNKNKGFTIIELILSFSITAIIVVLLFQLLLFLKDIYNDNGYKTELFIKQALISNEINNELENKTVTSIKRDFDNCNNDNEFCIEFTFDNGSSISNLVIDAENNTIKYGDFATKLVTGSVIGTIDIVTETRPNDYNGLDSFAAIIIPISHQLYEDEDFGITIVCQYNKGEGDIDNLAW